MSASITDKFTKASSMNGYYPRIAVVTSARQAGATILQCDDFSTWATDTAVHFSTYTVNADGTIDPATQTDWKGIVSGNNITELTRIAGADDSGNATNDRVELNPTIGWLDDLTTGLLQTHNKNGTLKDSSVGTSTITNGAVTAAKIASGVLPKTSTNDNLSPASDTPSGWGTLLSNTTATGVTHTAGYFVTWYTVSGKFSNQPSTYGFLETFRQGSDIYQRWHSQSAGRVLYRSGNGSGWNTPSSGAFNTIPEWDYTTVDPGANSSLDAGRIVAVYEA